MNRVVSGAGYSFSSNLAINIYLSDNQLKFWKVCCVTRMKIIKKLTVLCRGSSHHVHHVHCSISDLIDDDDLGVQVFTHYFQAIAKIYAKSFSIITNGLDLGLISKNLGGNDEGLQCLFYFMLVVQQNMQMFARFSGDLSFFQQKSAIHYQVYIIKVTNIRIFMSAKEKGVGLQQFTHSQRSFCYFQP